MLPFFIDHYLIKGNQPETKKKLFKYAIESEQF